MTETHWQAALLLAVWTVFIFRMGMKLGRSTSARDALSGPPAAPRPRMPIPDDVRPAIEDALKRRKKIEAIRILRKATGLGLKDAKESIEAEWG